jgi:hypothetical protein
MASIRQRLLLGSTLAVHVPLCSEHSQVWEAFAESFQKLRKKAVRERRDADWLLDAALAIDLFPPNKPL